MPQREKEISCIGISFVDPILELALKLRELETTGTIGIRASSLENGYSCSIIALSVLMIESVLNRVRYMEKDKDSNLKIFNSKFK